MRFSTTLSASALAVGASAADKYLGFNSGSTLPDHSPKMKKDFMDEFVAAQGLQGAPGTFNAVRLYTNIQATTKNAPIEAFEAAMDTKTKILLGVWASGTDSIEQELSALKTAVDKHGQAFTDLVIGISIGSEDLYRNSLTGAKNKAGVGADPAVIVKFIGDYKTTFANTPLANTPVGHVDTWDVWGNGTNAAVIDAVDWIGVDEYPYYENGKGGNDIKKAPGLFDVAYDAATAAAKGKPVWLTETGWPVSGPDWEQAVPSLDNAKYYWDNIGCRRLFNQVPTFWYTLRDSNPDNLAKFAITKDLNTGAAFNLTCPTTFDVATPSGTTTPPSQTSGFSGASGSNGGSSGSNPGSSNTNSNPSPSPSGKNAGAHVAPAAYLAVMGIAAAVVCLL